MSRSKRPLSLEEAANGRQLYAEACEAIRRHTGWRIERERTDTARVNLVAYCSVGHIDLALGVSAATATEIVFALATAVEAAARRQG